MRNAFNNEKRKRLVGKASRRVGSERRSKWSFYWWIKRISLEDAKRRFLFDEVRFEREDLRKSMFFDSNGRVVESCCSYFYWCSNRRAPPKVESGRKVGIFHSKSLSRINPIGFLFLSLVMIFRNLESWDLKKLESGSQTHQQTQLTEISQ